RRECAAGCFSGGSGRLAFRARRFPLLHPFFPLFGPFFGSLRLFLQVGSDPCLLAGVQRIPYSQPLFVDLTALGGQFGTTFFTLFERLLRIKGIALEEFRTALSRH